jgi:hypothetical protein
MLITASSPYAKRGIIWDTYRQHFGPDGSPTVLVAKGTTAQFNPTIPQAEIDRELERDPIRNRAEYLAEFRDDISGYVSPEIVLQCTTGLTSRPPSPYTSYSGFVDLSGGSVESAALAIGHFDSIKSVCIVDLLLEQRAPFSPELTARDFAVNLRAYRVHKIQGDKYASQWPVELFQKFGISYEQSAAPKSDLYAGLLSLLNSRRIELVDYPRLSSQLCSLERRTARGGRDSIDHPPGGMDDCANAVAGLAALLTQQPPIFNYAAFNGSADGGDPNEDWMRLRRTLYYESAGTFDLNNRR